MFIKRPLPEYIESITAKRRQQDENDTKTIRKRYENDTKEIAPYTETLHCHHWSPTKYAALPGVRRRLRLLLLGTQASRLRAGSHKLLSYAKLSGYAGVPAC